MEQNRLNECIDALNSKGVSLPCPRCTSSRFSVVGESFISINDDPNTVTIGGPSIPTILVSCDNCGYITQHVQVTLGLFNQGAKK